MHKCLNLLKNQSNHSIDKCPIKIPMSYKELETEKLYYSMGDVSKMLGVNPSLIRFWEKELGVIQLKKNKKGNRLFTLSDIEKLKTIYTLVKQKGFTLQGAKNVVTGKSNIQALSSNDDVLSKLQKLKSQLLELAKEL